MGNSASTPLPILAVPACEAGRGGGHIVRCMALVRGLRALNREAWLCATEAHNNLLNTAEFDRNWLITENEIQNKQWECIILDRFQTPAEELSRWMKLAPVIGIDEGGRCRDSFDFLIDILPGCSRIKPNIADPSLLPLPEPPPPMKPAEKSTPLKVLISFGQEDAASLGIAAANALVKKNEDLDITLLHGTLTTPYILHPTSYPLSPTPHSLKIINAIPNLSAHLGEYDLLITHYGLTAFEALYAGVPVLLVSPTPYHEKLAKVAGFYSLGIGKKATAKLNKVNTNFIAMLKKKCNSIAIKYNLNHAQKKILINFINTFLPDVERTCPVCGAVLRSAVLRTDALARFEERTYRRCKRCGIISMDRLTPPPIEYGKEYFFEAYQKQYGKTYIEDFPTLIAMGKRRLAIIQSLLKKTDTDAPTLLDIGCAYGPFLAAAKEEGFSPQGIDPAEDAVRYVTQTLGIPAVQGFFPQSSILHPASYSVITLWYVIEHFRDCVPVLAEIRKLLKDGGILAFSTPSFSGISGRSSLGRFLERSPADHWTIWSPHVCKKALKAAGFTVKKMVNSGHHPERFPLLGRFAGSKKSPLYWLLMAASRIFSLGDTFEVYATAS